MSDRRGVSDTDFEVQGREIQTRGSSACSSLNRCEPSFPNSIPARGVIEGHNLRPDTRPIEDSAEKSKIKLAKKGASTHGLCRRYGGSSVIKPEKILLLKPIIFRGDYPGNASLSHLRRFKVDKLKIDKSFVDDFNAGKGDRAIIEGIIGISKGFGMSVTAEGVEKLDQAIALKQMGCDTAQGYFFEKPMSYEGMIDLLRSGKYYPL